MSSLLVPHPTRYNHELLFISGPCINIDSLSTRRQRRTKIMLRIMDNPTVTRKLRRSCKFTSSRSQTPIFTSLNRAGFSGAFIDREVETRGVSALLFFVHFLRVQFCMYSLTTLTERRRRIRVSSSNHIRSDLISCSSSLSANQQLHDASYDDYN